MYEQVEKAIEDFFKANWTATAVDYPNVQFTQHLGTSFIRLRILWVDGFGTSVGTRERHTGLITVSLFIPQNIASSQINQYLDSLSTLLQQWDGDSGLVNVGVPKVYHVGQREEWYQKNIHFPFYTNKCRGV